MRQLVSGIEYLHSKDKNKWEIIHRDLKLENILLHFDNEDDRIHKRILKAKIKIIDFGFARYLIDELAQSALGTAIFMDPKILFKINRINNTNDFGYDTKVDIYSLGIICFYLLTGHPLFDVDTMEDLLSETKLGKLKISADLSKETISFLNYMLRYDPKKRLNISQLSKHKFITSNVKDFTRIDRRQLEENNLEGSQLVIDLNTSYIGYLNKSMIVEKEEPDEFQKKIIKKLNEAEVEGMKKQKGDNVDIMKESSLITDIEKMILESFGLINDDSMSIEPKIIPFIPGNSKNILL